MTVNSKFSHFSWSHVNALKQEKNSLPGEFSILVADVIPHFFLWKVVKRATQEDLLCEGTRRNTFHFLNSPSPFPVHFCYNFLLWRIYVNKKLTFGVWTFRYKQSSSPVRFGSTGSFWGHTLPSATASYTPTSGLTGIGFCCKQYSVCVS